METRAGRGNVAYKTLRVDSANAITTIYLNRPSARNSLNVESIGELREVVNQLREDSSTRAVIVTGSGRIFSAGADLEMLTRIAESYTPEETRTEIVKWRRAFDALEALPQVTVAAVNGVALGGGVVLALACDFRIASSRAIFGFPEIKMGMVLALGGTQRLARAVGPSAAKEMILRGRNVNAIEAQRIGLVHRICDPGDLMGLARSWAERTAGYAPEAVALAKRLIDQSLERDADSSAEAETTAQVELLRSPEFLERVRSAKESGEV